MLPEIVAGDILTCQFALCSLEEDPIGFEAFRCSSYKQFTDSCYDLGVSNNINFDFHQWRNITNCRKYFFFSLNHTKKHKH
jgi:hypothetical protein